MRQRKLISLVAVAAFGLTACGSGSSGAVQAEGSASAQTVGSGNQILTGRSLQAAPASGPTSNGFVNWIWKNSSMNFGMMFAGFPGTWAAGVLQSLIFGVQEDVSIKYMKEISEKLDQILSKLELSMNISAITLDTISEFYKTYTGNALTDSFTLVQTSISDVDAKYSEFTTANAFGAESSTVTDLSSLYTYAEQHCNDVAIIDAIDVTSSTTGTDSQYDVDTMFTTFTTTYSAESTTLGDASAYKKVATSKTNYKNAIISSIPKSIDFTSYINRYNYTVKYYATHLVGAYQELYNMQLAQLAYHYACNASIEFSNLGNISGSGKSGFEQSVTELDSKYGAKFTNLNNNVNTYFSSISNTEIYTMINTQYFSSSKPLLDSTTFNSNVGNAGECTVNKLQFNQSSNSSVGDYSGVVDFGAICVKSKTGSESETKYESATISLEIPYHSSNGKTIDRYGQSNIKYESANNDFTSDVSTDSMSSDDVNKIFYLKPEIVNNGTYWENKESMNLIAPSWARKSTGMDYAGFNISTANGVKFYTNKYTNSTNASLAEKAFGISYGDIIPPYDDSNMTFTSEMMQRFYVVVSENTEKSVFCENCGSPWDRKVGWDYWILANYHGKTFAVKFVVEHVADSYSYFGDSYSNTNAFSAQAVGAFCLTSNCGRSDDGSDDNNNQTTLNWTDGTKVVFDNNDDMSTYTTGSKLYQSTFTGSITK